MQPQAWQFSCFLQESLDAERAQPLRRELVAAIAGRPLITSELAVQQFETLLNQFGGPSEKERWRQVLKTITVVPWQRQSEQLDGRAPVSAIAAPGVVPSESPAGSDLSPVASAPARMIAPCGAASVQSCVNEELTAQSSGEEASVRRWPDRVAHLERLGACAKAVLGLGDAAHALTLTANGKAVQTAARQGVLLETYVHRAAWLTGM